MIHETALCRERPTTCWHANREKGNRKKGNTRKRRLFILVREHLFTTLAAGHTLLLLLAHLAGSEFGLLLLGFDLVACKTVSISALS